MDEKISIYSKYATRYTKSDTKTASGKRKSMDIGDALAVALRGKTAKTLTKIAEENRVDVASWKDLNPGRFRMQIGRALRLVFKSQGFVLVDGEKITKL